MIYVMSGGGKAFAVIGVNYPEGSTCTCSDGTKTLKLKDTSGQGLFLIPYAGTWTVTATDGTNTKSESVEISTEGQIAEINLAYETYIFKSGEGVASDWYTSTDSGYPSVNADRLYCKFNYSNYGYVTFLTANVLDLTGVETIVFEVVSSLTDDTYGICSTKTTKPSFEAKTSPEIRDGKTVNFVTVDVSACNGKYYVGLYATRPNGGSATITNIYYY